MKKSIVALCLLFFPLATIGVETAISAAEAQRHVGEYAKVCGLVASSKYASRSNGAPTFLNLDAPYPNQIFPALVWIEDRAKFGRPEVRYLGKRVCVSGVIRNYRGTTEIILRHPQQLEPSGN